MHNMCDLQALVHCKAYRLGLGTQMLLGTLLLRANGRIAAPIPASHQRSRVAGHTDPRQVFAACAQQRTTVCTDWATIVAFASKHTRLELPALKRESPVVRRIDGRQWRRAAAQTEAILEETAVVARAEAAQVEVAFLVQAAVAMVVVHRVAVADKLGGLGGNGGNSGGGLGGSLGDGTPGGGTGGGGVGWRR